MVLLDAIVELSDDWLQDHRSLYTPKLCGALSSAFTNVFMYSDTPRSVCGTMTRAACGNVHHGMSIWEAQFKRECILSDYVQHVPQLGAPAWVLSLDQDVSVRLPLLHHVTRSFPIPHQPLFMGFNNPPFGRVIVIGAFFMATRSCLWDLYGVERVIDRCKRSFYTCKAQRGKECSFPGAYDHKTYNNDHLLSFCLASNYTRCERHRGWGQKFGFLYNHHRRTDIFSDGSHENMVTFATHHTPPNVSWMMSTEATPLKRGAQLLFYPSTR